MSDHDKLARRLLRTQTVFGRYQTASKRQDGTMHPTKYPPLGSALEDYGRLSFLSGYLQGTKDALNVENGKK